MNKLRSQISQISLDRDKVIGIVSIVLFLALGTLTIYWRPFTDEADNLVTGWLITEGDLLYKDIFSHHFPFTYYWVAAIIALFGKSIFAIRYSILLFQAAIFLIAMCFNRRWSLVGLVAIVWGVIRLFYRGNVVLYSSISGPTLFAIFVVSFSIIRNNSFSKSGIVVIALFSSIAFLSDPLSIYAILVAYLFLIFTHARKALASGLIFASIMGVYLLYLLGSKTFSDFWQNAIFFNQVIYNNYTPSSAFRIREFFEALTKGLDLFNHSWLNFDPFYKITLASQKYDTWAFTGFFFRFSIIIGSIALIFQNENKAALFSYLFSAAVVIISPWEFRAQAFVLISLFFVVSLTIKTISPKTLTKLPHIIFEACCIIISVSLVWLFIRSSIYLYQNRSQFLYENTFTGLELKAKIIKEKACDLPNAQLISYPGGIYNYWFSGMKPVAGYCYMWPWVAEVGLPEVIQTIDQPEFLGVVLHEESVVWGIYDSKVFLEPLDIYLTDNYILTDNGIWISLELAKRCK